MRNEASEQIEVVRDARAVGIYLFHVPNGGRRSVREATLLRAMGVMAGVPDLLILDRPPSLPACCGTAVEMKRARDSQTTDVQRKAHASFRARGWHVIVARGADDARTQLRAAGYRL